MNHTMPENRLNNNIADTIDKYYREVGHNAIIKNILKLMNDLRNTAIDPLKRRRWVWELLQNAKDVASNDKPITIEIVLSESKNQLEFKHNGKPFNAREITYLINQVSTKDRQQYNQDVKPIGKFGTGFITTHLLSEKVMLSAILQEKNEDEYLDFDLIIDRSGKYLNDIEESIKISLNTLKQIAKSRIIHKNYDENDVNNNIFRYELEESGRIVAQRGIEDLHVSLPFTLPFVKNIEKVRLLPEEITYTLKNKPDIENNNIQIITVEKTTPSNIESLNVALLAQEEVTIAIPIERRDDQWYIKEFTAPCLFCDFPLIGTESFHFPAIINSSHFNPTEQRNTVYLDGITPEIHQNQEIIEKAVKLYFSLLNYAAEQNWQNLYLLAQTKIPEVPDISVLWYENTIQKQIAEGLIKIPIVDTNHKGRLAIEFENGKNIYFPSANTNELCEKLWQLCSYFDYFILPCKKDIHNWNKIIDWNDTIIWKRAYRLDSEVLIKYIAEQKDITTLTGKLKKNKAETIRWLNQFYEFLHFEETTLNLLDKYAVIPNQKEDFSLKKDLYIDQEIDEELKNILLGLEFDCKKILVLREINISSFDPSKKKTQKDISDQINSIIKDCRNGRNKNLIEQAKQAAFCLISCFVEQDIPQRQERWELAKIFYPERLDLVKHKKMLKYYLSSLWEECDAWIIGSMVNKISEKSNLTELSNALNLNRDETLKYLNKFIDVLIEQKLENDLDKKPILPNQNGDFKTKENLFFDAGDIDDILKNILAELEYDIRKDLSEKMINFKRLSNRNKTQKDITKEITNRVYAILTKETDDLKNGIVRLRPERIKQIFSSLLLWFDEHKNIAKDCFGELYENCYRLRSNEEIVDDIKYKQEIHKNNVNNYSREEIIEILKIEHVKNIIDQSRQYSEVFTNQELQKVLMTLREDNPRFIKKIIAYIENEKEIYAKRNYLQQLGRDVEDLLKEVFLQTDGFEIKKEEGKRDFVLRIKRHNIDYSIEVKSTTHDSHSVLMSWEQGEFAFNQADRYVLCVINRDELGEDRKNSFKVCAKFVTDIGHKLRDKVQEASKIYDQSGDITIELERRTKFKFRISKKIWQQGKTFEEFKTYLNTIASA